MRRLPVAAGNDTHALFARVWGRLASRVIPDEARRDLLADLSGAVVEVGAGDGQNFRHYPSAVSSVWAVEPEPLLRERALRRARQNEVPIEVVDGRAESLPAADDSFDHAVCCLVLCSVRDQGAALAELRRVLRPGGSVYFYEHVAAHDRRRRLQELLDRTGLWPHLAAGCHLARDTAAALTEAGFVIEHCEEFESGIGRLTLPHIAGTARLPGRSPVG